MMETDFREMKPTEVKHDDAEWSLTQLQDEKEALEQISTEFQKLERELTTI